MARISRATGGLVRSISQTRGSRVGKPFEPSGYHHMKTTLNVSIGATLLLAGWLFVGATMSEAQVRMQGGAVGAAGGNGGNNGGRNNGNNGGNFNNGNNGGNF